jgi:hypothetical protein
LHQLTTKAFPQRMVVDELLELADEVVARAERQFRIDALLEGRQARLLEAADLVAGERLEGEILERRPAPECECRAQSLRPLGWRALTRF